MCVETRLVVVDGLLRGCVLMLWCVLLVCGCHAREVMCCVGVWEWIGGVAVVGGVACVGRCIMWAGESRFLRLSSEGGGGACVGWSHVG